jgi:hypothetical protein
MSKVTLNLIVYFDFRLFFNLIFLLFTVKSDVASFSCELCEYSTQFEEQLIWHVRAEHDEDSD